MPPAPPPQPPYRASRGSRVASFAPLSLGAVLLPLLLFAVGAWLAWVDVRREAEFRALRVADMLQEHALRALQTQEAMLEAIEARLAGLDWEEIRRSEEIHRWLGTLGARTPISAGFGLVDPDRRLVMAGRTGLFPLEPIDLSDRDYVRAAAESRAGPVIGAAVASRLVEERVFAVARARRADSGLERPGVLVAAVQVEVMGEFYRRLMEGRQDRLALVRTDGAVLVREPPLAPGQARLPAGATVMSAALREPGRGGLLLSTSAVDGVPRLNAWRWVGDYPVLVSYGLDMRTVQQAWWRRVALLGVVSAVAAALLLGLAVRAQRSAGREAAALAAAAQDAEAARREAEARAETEARLRQVERSAALGRITAGVAHDMNNLVQAVLASATLLERRAGETGEVRRIAGLLSAVAARGKRVAQRMLTFGRPASQPDGGFLPAEALGGLDEILGGLLGSGVRLEVETDPDLPPVAADRAEFETVLLNLAVNARDAMPDGGVVRVRAVRQATEPDGFSGTDWVRVSVADSGHGMSPEVLTRVGEPFFTTKQPGQGTGLGLMMARQFAERAGGALTIESREGVGTTVSIWLPARPVTAAEAAADTMAGRQA